MIPKIIHYVWVGGEKPKSVKHNINEWKAMFPDYEFIEWNEENWNISSNCFANYFYNKGKNGYGFVGDPIRVDVLDRFGGIYLDTDVHIYKKFDSFLGESLVFGRIYNNAVGTAVILSEKGNPLMHNLSKLYKSFTIKELDNPDFDKISNGIFTRYFINEHLGMKFGNGIQRLDNGTLLLPKQYFELPSFWFEKGGYFVHDQSGSWNNSKHNLVYSNSGMKNKIKKMINKIDPTIILRHQNMKACKSNSIYKEFGKNI